MQKVYANLNFISQDTAVPSLNDLFAMNTVMFMLIIQLVVLASCTLVGLAIKTGFQFPKIL